MDRTAGERKSNSRKTRPEIVTKDSRALFLSRRGERMRVRALRYMGHATLDTTRSYTRSSEADRARAIDQALIADE